MAIEALVKPSTNTLTIQYNSSTISGSNCVLSTFSMVVVGHKLNIQAELVDVTNGVDTGRRYAKTGLVEGRLVVTGYMLALSSLLGAGVVDATSGTGLVITMDYGNTGGTKNFNGFIESIEVNSNKTQPYVGVAISFKLSGAVT
jgi:hypothetical protein